MDAKPHVAPKETRPWHAIPKEERDQIVRAAGMRPPQTDEPFHHFEAIRTPMTFRSLWHRFFSR